MLVVFPSNTISSLSGVASQEKKGWKRIQQKDGSVRNKKAKGNVAQSKLPTPPAFARLL
jgi:hypothetical protein